MPFAIFIEATTGLVAYVEGSAPQVIDLVTPRMVWPAFAIGRQEPSQRVQRIHVRWTLETNDAARREREARYGLTRPDEGEEHTWSYVLDNEAPDKARHPVELLDVRSRGREPRGVRSFRGPRGGLAADPRHEPKPATPSNRRMGARGQYWHPPADAIRARVHSPGRSSAGGAFPELFFYSERGFAGGQVYLLIDWHSSVRDQRLTVARLSSERAPVVIVDVSTRDLVWAHFPVVADYVGEHYVQVAESTFGGDTEYSVLSDRRLPASGTYEPLGRPCFLVRGG
jgi:hypothetical protein